MARHAILGALALLLLALLTPTLAAQGVERPQLTLVLAPPGSALDPYAAPRPLDGSVEMRTNAGRLEDVEVELRVLDAPAWLDVRLGQERLVLTPAMGDGATRQTFTAYVRADHEGRAFTGGVLALEARTRPTLTQAEAVARVEVPVVLGFHGALAARALEKRVEVEPGRSALVAVALKNVGNGPEKAVASMVAPHDLREGATLTLAFTPHAAFDGALRGEPVEVAVRLEPAETPLEVQVGGGRARDAGALEGLRALLPATGALAGGATGFALARRARP